MDKNERMPKNNQKPAGEKEKLLQQAHMRWQQLHEFRLAYTVDIFLKDLHSYFDGEVDFNIEAICARVSAPGKLSHLVELAKKKGTHPVSEFISELLKESAQE